MRAVSNVREEIHITSETGATMRNEAGQVKFQQIDKVLRWLFLRNYSKKKLSQEDLAYIYVHPYFPGSSVTSQPQYQGAESGTINYILLMYVCILYMSIIPPIYIRDEMKLSCAR